MQHVGGKMKKVGILALQGAVSEHLNVLKQFDDVMVTLVKTREQLDEVQALIIPGGESTTMGRLLRDFELLEPLKKRIEEGMPTFGTCAGLILMAKTIEDETSHLGVMDIVVRRNAYGRQVDSFSDSVRIEAISDAPIPLVFIRAPYVTATSEDVEILLKLENHIVACRQKNMLVTSFHPELTTDTAVHRYFLEMID